MGRERGGGGHSSGGSHSHSSGSHGSSHSHSSSRSYSSSSSSSSRNYSSNRSYSGGTHHHYHHYSGGGYGGPSRYGAPVRHSIIKDVIAWIFTIILIVIAFSVITNNNCNSSKIPTSTTQRERVETKNAYINDCVIDEIGWINNKTKLASRLKEFYKIKTKVKRGSYVAGNLYNSR